jgi:hypothetical protein
VAVDQLLAEQDELNLGEYSVVHQLLEVDAVLVALDALVVLEVDRLDVLVHRHMVDDDSFVDKVACDVHMDNLDIPADMACDHSKDVVDDPALDIRSHVAFHVAFPYLD